MYVMKVHARTRWVNVPDLEKMLGKVPWLLGEVSLYEKKMRILWPFPHACVWPGKPVERRFVASAV